MDDPRFASFLALAQERSHPFYAYGAWELASRCGNLAAALQALQLGAANYVQEPCVYGAYIPGEEAMLDQIMTGDARELAEQIPDSSIDLIFTDPVYQQTDDCRWLAEQALRVLAPKGKLLVWVSKPKLARSQIAMEDAGLEYVYTLDYTVTAKTYRMRWYNLFCWTTPCLWFQRDGSASRPRRWIPDTYTDTIVLDGEAVQMRAALGDTFVSSGGPNGSYIWNKNLGVLKAWIDAFSAPGAAVWDPFTGSGSVPVVCKLLGRHFYASEIEPDVAKEARARLESTPLPMAGVLSDQIEQFAMELV